MREPRVSVRSGGRTWVPGAEPWPWGTPLPPSCQFLAQNTHPHTPPEKGRKALLERLRQGM